MRRSTRGVGAALALSLLAGACGGSHHQAGSKVPKPRIPVPAPVTKDDWHPPDVSGPPSAGTFCRGLVADYKHTQGNAIATTTKVKKQILQDFVAFTPKVIAAAPAEISGPAATYLGTEVKIIQILLKYNLDASKAPPGSIGVLLDDPKVAAAGPPLAAYAQSNCHFDITTYSP